MSRKFYSKGLLFCLSLLIAFDGVRVGTYDVNLISSQS